MVLFGEPYSFGLYSYSEVFFLIYIVKFLVMIFSYNHLLQPITAFCFGETLFYFLIADTFRLLTLSYFHRISHCVIYSFCYICTIKSIKIKMTWKIYQKTCLCHFLDYNIYIFNLMVNSWLGNIQIDTTCFRWIIMGVYFQSCDS